MSSEKMRYIRQRMEDNPGTDIELTPLKFENCRIWNRLRGAFHCHTLGTTLSGNGCERDTRKGAFCIGHVVETVRDVQGNAPINVVRNIMTLR